MELFLDIKGISVPGENKNSDKKGSSKIVPMRKRTPRKVTPFRTYSWLNIGTILFLAILIYMIITVILFATSKRISIYEVTSGSISGDYRYSALAIKNEEIETAQYSGYVTYYAREGSRIGAGSAVCSISENKNTGTEAKPAELTDDDYRTIRSVSASFSQNFDKSAFQSVYTYKSDLESFILSTQENAEAVSGSLSNEADAPESGFVVYRVDGMENLTDNDITTDLFNTNNYEFSNLRLNESVKTGDSLYKLVKGEDWYLYFPITDDLATELAGRTTMRFRFLSDDTTFVSSFSEYRNQDQWFGKITLHNSLVRYVSNRYVEIELLLDSESGLKVPSSSIASEQFYRIPDEYVTPNPDTGREVTLLVETYHADNTSKVTSKTVTVYEKQENTYLISTDDIKTGDRILKPDSSKYHEVTADDLTAIQGVYNVNQGYAIFREVTITDQNEEFCIVKPNSPYGLAAHDFIALDASEVSEDDIV
jgi:hypothetical protein